MQNGITKEKKSEHKLETEEDFYQFPNLWIHILLKEGWKCELSCPNDGVLWCILPGHSGRSFGIQYYDNVEDVVRYCKAHNYYAKYVLDSRKGGAQENWEGSRQSNACRGKTVETTENNQTGQYDRVRLPSKITTARQKKMRASHESKEEQDFYKFGNLWGNILVQEGWDYVESKGTMDTWWYVRPGGSTTNGTLGTDYFNAPEGVVQYCKIQKYYAKYGKTKVSKWGH